MITIIMDAEIEGWTPPGPEEEKEVWNFPLSELPYLVERERDNAAAPAFVLHKDRLYEQVHFALEC